MNRFENMAVVAWVGLKNVDGTAEATNAALDTIIAQAKAESSDKQTRGAIAYMIALGFGLI